MDPFVAQLAALCTARPTRAKWVFVPAHSIGHTDPVQAEIVFLLAAANSGEPNPRPVVKPRGVNSRAVVASRSRTPSVASSLGPTVESTPNIDWRTVPLRPGALFVVGDPKQSIYRFRRADIDIYNIVRERFSDPAVGRVVPLTLNFRSVPELCNWANGVFQTRFPKEPSLHAPRFAALDAYDTKPTPGGVLTLSHDCDRGEVQERDAQRIAAYIRAEVDGKRRSFSDFLILTRKKRDRIAPYAQALELLNIPIEVSGAGAFGESAEVAALTVLLRALADPQDALSLIAVLRGPLFGISDPQLFAFKQSGGWFSLFAATDGDVGGSGHRADARGRGDLGPDACREALGALHRYYRWTRVLPAAAALDRILEDTGYLALAATTQRGVDAGDILHAIDRVRQVMEGGGSLVDAADSLEADIEAANEVESLPLEPGRTDVVRLMNLHKAKGLEAAVVFLADPAGGLTPRVDVHIERTGLKARGWLKVVRKTEGSYFQTLLGEHADWSAHEAAELPYLQAEEDRLLYVAATRARELLVVSRSTEKQRRAWGVLNDFLSGAVELPVSARVRAPSVSTIDFSVGTQSVAAAGRVSAHRVATRPSWEATSVTADAKHIARMTRSDEPSGDDPSKVVSTDTPAHRADAGMAWGSLIHGLLEHAMQHKAVTREDLRRLAMWLTVEEPQLRTVIDQALDTVERAARADFWQVAREAEHSVETPFSVLNPASQLTSGVIDLLFRSADGWQVVDYKTDLALDRQLYKTQLDAYRAALRQIGCSVTEAAVVSVRSVS